MVAIFRAAFSLLLRVLGIPSGFGLGCLLLVPLHQRGMVPGAFPACTGPLPGLQVLPRVLAPASVHLSTPVSFRYKSKDILCPLAEE